MAATCPRSAPAFPTRRSPGSTCRPASTRYPIPCRRRLQKHGHDCPNEAEEEALIAAAARRYGVSDPATIVAAPGTQALIQMLPRLLPPSRVAILGPTYEEHEVCWRRQGHEASTVTDPDQAKEAEVVVVVNPDNPTGRLLAADELPSPSKLLVVDEAFIDLLAPGQQPRGQLPPRTIVLRSFGKTYGLAGLRLGFAIAGRELAEGCAANLVPGQFQVRIGDRSSGARR